MYIVPLPSPHIQHAAHRNVPVLDWHVLPADGWAAFTTAGVAVRAFPVYHGVRRSLCVGDFVLPSFISFMGLTDQKTI